MMKAALISREIQQPAPVPRLLVELPSWRRVFVQNLRDLISPEQLPRVELQSAPAPFWPDVFVRRELPWRRFILSVACHVVAGTLLIAFTRLFALQPQAVLKPAFDRSQVILYGPTELPPLDTRSSPPARPRKADPEFSRQPIISVPPEADNRVQTIVTPPNIKLKHDVALPNIVAWSDAPQKPRLDIPPAPLTLAAEITRIAPEMDSVVAPPPDAAHLARRAQPALQSSVVAPPADVRQFSAAAFLSARPAIVAPPPSVEASNRSLTDRNLGDLNIARSAIIAPAPQLAVGEQRAVAAGRLPGAVGIAPQVVAPPPSLLAAGSRGRVIALNLHPVVGAPPDPPPGNRRGAFAATPEGHAGASGAVGTEGRANDNKDGGGPNRKATGDHSGLPPGLYVGSAAKPAPVAGSSDAGNTAANPNLAASVHLARATSTPARAAHSETAAKLSDAEREVFGDRKFYSLTLTMPNLNSAGGSWVIRFAELNHDAGNNDTAKQNSGNHDSADHDSNPPASDLSQPVASRKVDPAYPLQLMRENVAGTVILYAIIHADGTVGNVRVLRGVDRRLDQFASEAVAQWQFHPATKNGAAVDVEATFQIPFRPTRVGSNF